MIGEAYVFIPYLGQVRFSFKEQNGQIIYGESNLAIDEFLNATISDKFNFVFNNKRSGTCYELSQYRYKDLVEKFKKAFEEYLKQYKDKVINTFYQVHNFQYMWQENNEPLQVYFVILKEPKYSHKK